MMKKIIALLLACAAAMLSGCDLIEKYYKPGDPYGGYSETGTLSGDGLLEVHFIDAGQADAIYIKLPGGKTMQIDAGKNSTGQEIVDYIEAQGAQRIDYLIGTHPHEDHIGGLDNVIKAFDIGEIYMPRVSEKLTPTTKTYEDVLTAIKDKGGSITAPKAGDMIIDEGNLKAEVLSPGTGEYDGLNEYSIVVRLTYGDISFMLMGDAEEVNEQEIMSFGKDISCDVLKLGHHGSSTSSIKMFLQRCAPKYAVISCGEGNSYGHPHEEVVSRCEELAINMLRTDKCGDIIIKSDGKTIDIDTENQGE